MTRPTPSSFTATTSGRGASTTRRNTQTPRPILIPSTTSRTCSSRSRLGTNYSITVIGRGVNVNAVTAQTNNAAGAYAPNVVQDFALVVSCGEGEVTNAMTVTDVGPGSGSFPTPRPTSRSLFLARPIRCCSTSSSARARHCWARTRFPSAPFRCWTRMAFPSPFLQAWRPMPSSRLA